MHNFSKRPELFRRTYLINPHEASWAIAEFAPMMRNPVTQVFGGVAVQLTCGSTRNADCIPISGLSKPSRCNSAACFIDLSALLELLHVQQLLDRSHRVWQSDKLVGSMCYKGLVRRGQLIMTKSGEDMRVGVVSGFFDVLTAVDRRLFAVIDEHRSVSRDVWDSSHPISRVACCDTIVDSVAFMELDRPSLRRVLPPAAVSLARFLTANT